MINYRYHKWILLSYFDLIICYKTNSSIIALLIDQEVFCLLGTYHYNIFGSSSKFLIIIYRRIRAVLTCCCAFLTILLCHHRLIYTHLKQSFWLYTFKYVLRCFNEIVCSCTKLTACWISLHPSPPCWHKGNTVLISQWLGLIRVRVDILLSWQYVHKLMSSSFTTIVYTKSLIIKYVLWLILIIVLPLLIRVYLHISTCR